MATNAVKPFDANREYSGGQYKAGKRFEMRQGDPRVHALFVEFTNYPKRAATWSFQRRLISLAQELFAGEYSWFIRQDSNALMKDQNYAFVLDTVRYIATGRRKFSIHTWPALLTYEVPTVNESVTGRRDIFFLMQDLTVPTDVNAMIQKWLSHPDGINDMMYTIHMLFGSVHEKVSTESFTYDRKAGLEEILKLDDKIRFLKRCQVTLEGYQEHGNADEKVVAQIVQACKLSASNESFGDQLKEIGKRILAFLIEMLEKIEVYTLKFSEGIVQTLSKFQQIEMVLNQGVPLQELTLKRVPKTLMLEQEFVGDAITGNEQAAIKLLLQNRKKYTHDVIGKLRTMVNRGLTKELPDEISRMVRDMIPENSGRIKLPGGYELVGEGISMRVYDMPYQDRGATAGQVIAPAMTNAKARNNVGGIMAFLEELDDTGTASDMNTFGHELRRVIERFRREAERDPELAPVFEAFSKVMGDIITSLFHPRIYFMALGRLAEIQNSRASYYGSRLRADRSAYE